MDVKGKQQMVVIRSLVKKESSSIDGEREKKEQKHMVNCNTGDGDCESYKKKKLVLNCTSEGDDGGGGGRRGSSGGGMRCCQAEKCEVDLSGAKPYHRRHKVCEYHAKAQFVVVAGIRQRFCQQCSRFHELSEFDETKRSCRRRLAGHNERRRKNASEPHTQGSMREGISTQLNDILCGQEDDRGRIKTPIQENSTYKHFQIR